MGADDFDAYGILKLRGISRYRLPEEQPDFSIPGAFIAGGFLFGPGRVVGEVPYDPALLLWRRDCDVGTTLDIRLQHLRSQSAPAISSLQVKKGKSRTLNNPLG